MPLGLLRHGPKLVGALAVLAVLGVVWGLYYIVSDRARLQVRLAAAEAVIARQAETAEIHRAHLARAADEAREWQALSNDLQQMEGRDAPLSPLLSATANRLWGRDQGAD